MGGEDCGDVDSSLLAKREGHTCKPLMELCDNCTLLFVVDVLIFGSAFDLIWNQVLRTNLAEEPGNQISKDNGLVSLVVVSGRWDAGSGPQISLPFVEFVVSTACIEEQDTWSAVDEPSAVKRLDASLIHRLDCRNESWITGNNLFHLDGCLLRGSALNDVSLYWCCFKKTEISRVGGMGTTHRSPVQGAEQGVSQAILGRRDLCL